MRIAQALLACVLAPGLLAELSGEIIPDAPKESSAALVAAVEKLAASAMANSKAMLDSPQTRDLLDLVKSMPSHTVDGKFIAK
jgi:hypothetical protein